MAITNGYCTLSEIKERLLWPSGRDDSQDTTLERSIEASSRWIDGYCGRRFYADTDNATRYYTAVDTRTLFLADDVVSIGTLATDGDGDRTYEDTWSATDYDLQPLNAAADGEPYTSIAVTPQGNYSFSTQPKGVEIYGKFGLACPADVKEACLMQALRIYKRKDAPFGVLGTTELGKLQTMAKIDVDVKVLLAPWRKL